MKTAMPTVFLIDPDASTQSAVRELTSAMNLGFKPYGTGREFFASYRDAEPGCLVLEVRIADLSGMQIQRRLAREENPLPLIFLTAHADVSLAVELLRAGAIHFLQKPVRPAELLNAVREAIAVDRRRRRGQERWRRLSEQMAMLTAGEREVLTMIGQGKGNKLIASKLGLALRTVELRRVKLMEKLCLQSPTALLHYAILANRGRRPRLSRPQTPLFGHASADNDGLDVAEERRRDVS